MAVTSTSALPVSRTDRTGFLSAAIAAILFGAAYPVTAIALRSFQPVALAALTGTLALAVIVLLAVVGPLSRPRDWMLTRRQAGQLAVLGLLGGVAFAAAMNVAVGLAGPTITSFVATLYAVLATLFAVPLLGERIRPSRSRRSRSRLSAPCCSQDSIHWERRSWASWSPSGPPLRSLSTLCSRVAGERATLSTEPLSRSRYLSGAVRCCCSSSCFANRIGSCPRPRISAAVVALALLVVGPSTTAQLAVLASVKRVSARRTSAALLLTPLASAAIAAVVLNERLAPMEIVGAALVLAGIAGAGGALEFIARGRNRHGVATGSEVAGHGQVARAVPSSTTSTSS